MIEHLVSAYTITDLSFVMFAALTAGLARGFSGFGAALIFMPLTSSVIGPRVAAPLLLIIDAIAAAGLLPSAIPRSDKKSVAVMAIGGVVGIPIGTMLLSQVSQVGIRWFIAAVVVLLLALLMSGWRYHGQPKPAATIGVGTISGVFTGAAGTGGPPVVAYWLGGASDGTVVRANIVTYFAVATIITVVSYSISGLLKASLIPLCIASGPVYALGLYAGARLFGTASERTFRLICYALITGATIVSLPVFDPILR